MIYLSLFFCFCSGIPIIWRNPCLSEDIVDDVEVVDRRREELILLVELVLFETEDITDVYVL